MKKILLIQTGGTIAMQSNNADDSPELDIDRWSALLHEEIPELSQIAKVEAARLFFEDSSDISPGHWSALIRYIGEQYKNFDGFVILHGTDTMAYTASALSFGLQQLGKPVILTGSQVPMSNLRSDARRNLVNALEMATLPLCEVAICFNDHLFRGNRSTKMSIGDFDAFASPNFPPLAEIGLNIELHHSRNCPDLPLAAYPAFDPGVFLLKIFPGLSPKLLERIDLSGVKALVIEAFGSGNFPVQGSHSLLPFFRHCLSDRKLLVITSQAPYDSVDLGKYASGRQAGELGAVGAGDMTTEAVLTKIMYLLGQRLSRKEITR
ncbi:MAG: asparaginase, partial [Balneolaceae bacterium]